MTTNGLGFGDGVALAIHVNTLRAGGSTDYSARRQVRELTEENEKLEKEVKYLRERLMLTEKQSIKNLDQSVVNARTASAGFVVMNGMINAMVNLSPDVREKFRAQVVNYSNNRINELDKKYLDEGVAGGFKAVTIRELFSQDHQYKTLQF